MPLIIILLLSVLVLLMALIANWLSIGLGYGLISTQVGNWLVYAGPWHWETRQEWAGLWEIDLGFLHLRQYP